MYNRIPTFRDKVLFSSSRIQVVYRTELFSTFRSNLLSLCFRGSFSDTSAAEYEENMLYWNVDVDYPMTQRHISQELNNQTTIRFLNAISRMNFRRYMWYIFRESRTCLFHYSDQPHPLKVKEKLGVWCHHAFCMLLYVYVCFCPLQTFR